MSLHWRIQGAILPRPHRVRITSRTLYFMPGNVVCRLQMSTNRHVAGAPPQTPLRQLINSAPTDPLTGGEWVQTFPQTQPSSGLRLWPLNIFSGSASGRTSLFWRPVSPKSSRCMQSSQFAVRPPPPQKIATKGFLMKCSSTPREP